ncbi:MarR family transcriptional regulator [Actinoallomurus sp. NBC_01490]|jgi:DNA-binding MarR family transcriptional regulator|uniref:MarR family winged helix-turn-helix transcriptional regulator n=1 Tax=Actinoallomurus sp. NBC_01490 TaxID=2903557 RepID=UPI002E30443C|nr:MarR family transcriptional regulator [Actinoallomurus sp. NBC_01490]
MVSESRTGHDLVDSLTDAAREEWPEIDQTKFELTRRAVRLADLIEGALADCLAPRELTLADYGVLTALRSAGEPYQLRPRELQARLLLTSGGVSGVLNRLQKAGLIERHQDANDKRSSWVRLTDAGAESTRATLRACAAVQSDVLRKVPDDVARRAADALREVMLALEDTEPRGHRHT